MFETNVTHVHEITNIVIFVDGLNSAKKNWALHESLLKQKDSNVKIIFSEDCGFFGGDIKLRSKNLYDKMFNELTIFPSLLLFSSLSRQFPAAI